MRTEQKLGRQITHCPCLVFVVRLGCLDPAIEQVLAHAVRERLVLVVRGRGYRETTEEGVEVSSEGAHPSFEIGTVMRVFGRGLDFTIFDRHQNHPCQTT